MIEVEIRAKVKDFAPIKKRLEEMGAGTELSSLVDSIEAGLNFLEKLDFERAFVIAKVREVYDYQSFEICLDDVEVLGPFIEVEHPDKTGGDINKALKECKDVLDLIAPAAILEPKKYGDLMQEIINKNNKL